MIPFVPSWSPHVVQRVRAQVEAFRIPLVVAGTGWRYGCDPAFLERLRRHWLDEYDEAAAATELGRLPQYQITVDGVALHVVHVVGEARGWRPLLLSHGWPGSIYEYWRVIEQLAYPSRYHGRAEDAFDIVAPSLPGFAFSERPQGTTGPRRTAALFDTLMRESLGYDTYLAHGTDWGAGVTAWIALDRPESLEAIHLGYLLTRPDVQPQTSAERTWSATYNEEQKRIGAYSRLQETKPASLAYVSAGNPVGQLAWIVERFHDWADLRERSFENVFTLDELLTNAMLYILTDTFHSAVLYYADAEAENARYLPEGRRIEVPTAFSGYPSPAFPEPPREWVERAYNLTRWRRMPRGGHFPAAEVPEAFVADLRDWAGTR